MRKTHVAGSKNTSGVQTVAAQTVTACTDLVRALAGVLHDSDLLEVEIEQDGLRVRVSRQGAGAVIAAQPVSAVAESVSSALPVRDEKVSENSSGGRVVSSPMVGTVYLSPEPGADNFVSVGDPVREGQTLLLIEAMKTFNAVTAPASGKLAKILVSDEQPVEYGDALMVIE